MSATPREIFEAYAPKYYEELTGALLQDVDAVLDRFLTDLYKALLGVIGEAEPMKTLREDKWKSSAPYKRNQLREEQRQALAKLFGRES